MTSRYEQVEVHVQRPRHHQHGYPVAVQVGDGDARWFSHQPQSGIASQGLQPAIAMHPRRIDATLAPAELLASHPLVDLGNPGSHSNPYSICTLPVLTHCDSSA